MPQVEMVRSLKSNRPRQIWSRVVKLMHFMPHHKTNQILAKLLKLSQTINARPENKKSLKNLGDKNPKKFTIFHPEPILRLKIPDFQRSLISWISIPRLAKIPDPRDARPPISGIREKIIRP